MSPLRRIARLSSRIGVRLLAFNLLLVFLPVAGFLYLDTYEEQLLAAQERSMVQQGRILAAALSGRGPLEEAEVMRVLGELGRRVTARLRVLDAEGRPFGDTSVLGPRRAEAPGEAAEEPSGAAATPRSSWLYRLGAALYRLWDRLGGGGWAEAASGPPGEAEATAGDPPWEAAASPSGGADPSSTPDPSVPPTPDLDSPDPDPPDPYPPDADAGGPEDHPDPSTPDADPGVGADDAPAPATEPPPSLAGRPEVRAALEGRYGAATRVTPGQRSVTLHSAVPVLSGGEVVGAVLVSQSTLRLLGDLYALRLRIFEVFLASVAVAAVLSLLVSTTIARPLHRLRRQAAEVLDPRGRVRGRFQGLRRRDEIGDLARALEELSRRLGERIRFMESFAGDVSHEFKNPLSSIRAAAEVLAEVEEPRERRRFLALVEGEIARLERLLADLRELTRIEAGRDGEGAEPVALDELLSGLVEGRRLAAAAAEVEIDLDLPAERVAVRAEPDRLTRAFDNVLANAVSFSPAGTAVRVDLALADGEAVVTVADQGPGIPPEHLGRVFDRFFTYRPGDAGARDRHTGLGLAIVRSAVEGHGGAVAARNRPAGGAEVEIRLPLS